MIFISGPSTVGKNPLINAICEKYNYIYHVPWSSRKIRKEENGISDYHFVTKEEFRDKIADNTIVEWDYALSNYYGYTMFDASSEHLITQGLSRMTLRIKKKYPDKITTVFLMPKNIDNVINVLHHIYRGKDLCLRLELVEEELLHSRLFDYIFTVETNSVDLLKDSIFLNALKLS